MTILQQIHAWSKNLPAWQQDAIARLYGDRTLSPADLDDLYALAKAEVGIPDPAGRAPNGLDDAHVAPAPDATREIVLTGLKNVNNVNALIEDARLPIAATGITVIYGENGAGKSGYSRVFKKSCRARDRRETILPNANLPAGEAAPATATFSVMLDGEALELVWRDGVEPPAPLADVSIFDSYCARAYIDNQGDFAYAPYGLDILEGLVGVCTLLKARTLQDKAASAPSDAAYSALAVGDTQVGVMLRGIPRSTSAEDIVRLAVFDPAAAERLALIDKALAEADPKQKAAGLRQRAGRFEVLRDRIQSVSAELSAAKVATLAESVQKSNAAKAAAELASGQFKAMPGLLAGTGGEPWKELFAAARAFVRDSSPGVELQDLTPDAPCPLCQNPLQDEGVARLRRFDAFIQAAAEKEAASARAAATVLYRHFQDVNLELHYSQPLAEELATVDPAISQSCSQLQSALGDRKAGALSAAAGKLAWAEIPATPVDITPALSTLIAAVREQAAAMDATADEQLKAAMLAERAELDAVRRLVDVKEAVLESLAKHELSAKLQRCADGMATGGISRKSTDLSRTTASEELAVALNDELKRLKVHTLQVVMKPESPGGKTQFKLALQLPGGGSPSTILSEGEQRAIALASFLAEVRLSKSRGAIVLDDPVSSLDHRRRWEVAQRLAEEALTRQVVVFTHDIYFLLILDQKAKEVTAALTSTYIRRTPEGYGSFSEDLPFDVLGTRARLGRLKQDLVAVQKTVRDGDEDRQRQLTSEFYKQLRLAWERCVEEVLLNGAVIRFDEGVHTQSLKYVTVTDDDYTQIDAGMSKASKFEHDAASAVGRVPVPDPADLEEDLEKLIAWCDSLRKRMDQLKNKKVTRQALFAG